MDTGRFKRGEFEGVIRHQPNTGNSDMVQRFGTQVVIPVVRLEAQMMVRLHSIVSGVLQFVGEKLIHESDSAPLLKLVDQDAGSTLGNRLKGIVKLVTAIATSGNKHIAGQAL